MINEIEIVIRLLVAGALAALVGLERERQGQPAGLRTHIIVVAGASLAMSLSINLAMQFRPLVPNGDPARLAAQVISGIGFLGAGAILRFGASIKGLTTAASLWTMAIVGLVVGAGYYVPAAAATVLLLVALTILNMLEHRLLQPFVTMVLLISAEDRKGLVQEIRQVLVQNTSEVGPFTIDTNLRRKRVKIETIVKVKEGAQLDSLRADLAQVPGVSAFKLS
jgi:putative Mg2+ transporter-C (MgtC) family protein